MEIKQPEKKQPEITHASIDKKIQDIRDSESWIERALFPGCVILIALTVLTCLCSFVFILYIFYLWVTK